jgi:hypothetical protein
LKKNSNSPMKKEPRAKRAKAQRPVQRKTKEVLAELVEKLRGKLELKATSSSLAERPRAELSPNLDRLTVGVDLGDQWSRYCILGLQGETLSEGYLQTRQAEGTSLRNELVENIDAVRFPFCNADKRGDTAVQV